MLSRRELVISILDKAVAEADFREALLSDPKAAITGEFDVRIPDGLDIKVHEADSDTVHLQLPPRPEVLGEGQLEAVSGGCGPLGHNCF